MKITKGELKELGAATLGAVLALGCLLLAFYIYVSQPIVYYSYSTGQCRFVDDPSGSFDCEHLPPRYDPRWVQ